MQPILLILKKIDDLAKQVKADNEKILATIKAIDKIVKPMLKDIKQGEKNGT